MYINEVKTLNLRFVPETERSLDSVGNYLSFGQGTVVEGESSDRSLLSWWFQTFLGPRRGGSGRVRTNGTTFLGGLKGTL